MKKFNNFLMIFIKYFLLLILIFTPYYLYRISIFKSSLCSEIFLRLNKHDIRIRNSFNEIYLKPTYFRKLHKILYFIQLTLVDV